MDDLFGPFFFEGENILQKRLAENSDVITTEIPQVFILLDYILVKYVFFSGLSSLSSSTILYFRFLGKRKKLK